MPAIVSLTDATSDSCTIPDLWDLDCIGIQDSANLTNNDLAIRQFISTVTQLDRFRSLSKRLEVEPELKVKCDDVIQQQLRQGIIEQVSPSTPVGARVHYLPHQPVVIPQKPITKVRIVYDASAKARRTNVSLNDCLQRGPVLLPDLFGIVLRFCLPPIVMTCDTEKAILQISVNPACRDATRFLWFANFRQYISHPIQPVNVSLLPGTVHAHKQSISAWRVIQHHLAQQDDKQLAVAISENIFCCAIGVCTVHVPCSFVGTASVTYCIGCKVTVVGLHVLPLLCRACTESVGVRLR